MFNPFTSSGLPFCYKLDGSIRNLGSILSFINCCKFYINNKDPDQTPRAAASDQGLYCLPMSLLWEA